MVTLKEIAKICNVSIATVSNILNGKSNVSEETKNRILRVIEETGYKPNYMARGLRATKSKTIGMIVDDITAFGSPKIVEGIMEICEVFGYRSILSNLRIYSKWLNKDHTHQDFIDLVDTAIQEMLSLKVDGIIYVGAYSRAVNYLPTNLEIPIVIAYSYSENNILPSVWIDDEVSSYEMTNFLINKGHKKILVIQGDKRGLHSELRTEGYKRALAENNLPFDEKLLFWSNWDFRTAYQTAKENNFVELLKNNKITAIYCYNDLMAAGIYKYLEENEITPGKDIAITGFDNRDISECLYPALTTMGIRVYSIGRRAAEVLINMIKDIKPEEKNIKIPCLLFERESVPNITENTDNQ